MPILGNRLLRRQSITYLLRDEFSTDASAPLTSPRTCEPGPGTLTLAQNDGQLSIASAKLSFPGQTTPATGDQGFYGEKAGGGAFSRQAGRALLTAINLTGVSGSPYSALGWTRTASVSANNFDAEYYVASGNLSVGISNGANPGVVAALSATTDYQLAVVLRGTGAYYFIKGGAFAAWTLLWVATTTVTANLYPCFDNYNGVGTLDYVRVYDLSAPFTTDFGIATLNQSSPVSGSSYTTDADGLYHLTITAPGTLADQTELRYRVQDASNYWTAYLDSSGALKVDSVSGGVATNRLSVAGVITTSATVTLCVITSGSKHNIYTLSGSTWTKRGSELNISHLDTQTTLQPQIGSGWSASNLRAWSRTAATYAALG